MLLITFATVANAQIIDPFSWTSSFEDNKDGTVTLMFNVEMESPWHIYSHDLPEGGPIKTTINLESSELFEIIGGIKTDIKAEEHFDESFNMTINWFTESVTFMQTVKVNSDKPITIKGYVNFMGCNDETCLPPSDFDFELKVKATGESSESESEDDSDNSSLIAFFFISFGAGLLALLTPCVFPMIPMTVSYFMQGNSSKAQGRLKAALFGISIVLLYTLIGVLISVIFGPNAIKGLTSHWLTNLIIFLIFILFSFSFFGMFELTMPNWMISKADAQVDKGGYAGAFFMAVTLVLVSFSCTGPIVGGILVAASQGELLQPTIGMLGYSLAFAIPFTIFALFPSLMKKMPKSGGWLNSIKVVLAFVMVAFSFKYLAIADTALSLHLFSRETFIAIWVATFSLLGLYLMGKIKFSHDSDLPYLSAPRLMLVVVTFAFVIYLIPGMVGAPLKVLSGILPEAEQQFDINEIVRSEVKSLKKSIGSGNVSITSSSSKSKKFENEIGEYPLGIDGYYDLEEAFAVAKAANKPLFIDFTGIACSNCKKMKKNVWSDSNVLEYLENDFIMVSLYTDKEIELPKEEWYISTIDNKEKRTMGKKNLDLLISRFKTNTSPFYVVVNNDNKIVSKPYGYDPDPENFVKFLDNAKKAYSAGTTIE